MKTKYMEDKIRKVIRENIDKLFETPQSKEKPGIFNHTIYRLPSKEELENVNSFNLNAEEILNGFSYTIIGRGIFSDKNKEMIIQSIKMLCDLFPENSEYKTALKKAMELKPRARALNEGDNSIWEKFDFGKFADNSSEYIAGIKTCEQMYDCIFGMSMGLHFPFNPPDPLRTDFRNKMEELKQTDPDNFSKIEWMYNKVSGDFEPTPDLPPGAMY